MKSKILRMGQEYGGEITATFAVPQKRADYVHSLMGEDVDVDLHKRREHRSLGQNSLAWKWIEQIAQCITPPMNKEEVYFTMLKRYGQGGYVSVPKDRSESILRGIKYYEPAGEGEVNGKQFVHVMMYVGSSEYNTKEMWIFLCGVKQEADDLGIETMSDEELAELEQKAKELGL